MTQIPPIAVKTALNKEVPSPSSTEKTTSAVDLQQIYQCLEEIIN